MDPIRGVVELPVGMAIALLQRVPRSHADLNGNDVRLLVGKMVVWTWPVGSIAVHGKESAGNFVATFQFVGVRLQNRTELCVAVRARRVVDWRHLQVMDHPALIPAALVVNDKQS